MASRKTQERLARSTRKARTVKPVEEPTEATHEPEVQQEQEKNFVASVEREEALMARFVAAVERIASALSSGGAGPRPAQTDIRETVTKETEGLRKVSRRRPEPMSEPETKNEAPRKVTMREVQRAFIDLSEATSTEAVFALLRKFKLEVLSDATEEQLPALLAAAKLALNKE